MSLSHVLGTTGPKCTNWVKWKLQEFGNRTDENKANLNPTLSVFNWHDDHLGGGFE